MSLIVAAYNAAEYLPRLLDSINKAQCNEALQVIVVDDGSNDATPQVLDEYRRLHGDFPLQVVSQPNRGVSVARNHGLEFATGKYVWFVDADDEVNPACLATLIDLCRGDHDFLWLETLHCHEGNDNSSAQLPSALRGEATVSEFRKGFKGGGMLWQFLLKREIIEANKLQFVEWAKWFEDVDFLLQFQCHARNVYVYADTWCYRYYLNPSGAMRNSRYADRLRCSVRLSVNQLSRTYPDSASRRFCEESAAVSVAWCLREAHGALAWELYPLVKPYLPLPLAGTYKQKLQIALLNLSFRLYKSVFK